MDVKVGKMKLVGCGCVHNAGPSIRSTGLTLTFYFKFSCSSRK